jgi:hypothetical protein
MAPIRAGTWHLVGDGEQMTLEATVRFDIIWRSGAGDVVLATATNTFVPHPPGPGQFDAIRYEADLAGAAAPAAPGDKLVLKFTTTAAAPGGYYIPNGDGALVKGQTVNLTLPP